MEDAAAEGNMLTSKLPGYRVRAACPTSPSSLKLLAAFL